MTSRYRSGRTTVNRSKSIHRWPLRLKCLPRQRNGRNEHKTFWQVIFNPLNLSSPNWNNNGAGGTNRDAADGRKGWGVGVGGEWEVDNFAFHLLTAKHVVIIVRCPLVYLPLEDSCPLFVTMGPDNQLSMCPLSDVIYITRMSLLCCPLSACDQSFLCANTKQAFNRTRLMSWIACLGGCGY